jgi:hypothetical protein
MLAGMMLSGKPIEGSGVVLITVIVPVVIFSAAPSDTELAKANATIADNLIFMRQIPCVFEDVETLMKIRMNFNAQNL